MSSTSYAPPATRFRLLLAAAAAAVLMLVGAPAEAATAAGPGNDVSWPQCGQTLPKGQTFAIVGVNNGLANTTNPCLATELSWAGTSKGGTAQPLVAVYVNTANPGTAGAWWPSSNTYGGTTVANPYGQCTSGSVGAACSYMYGYAKAYDDANIRGVSNPASYTWWLDVESGKRVGVCVVVAGGRGRPTKSHALMSMRATRSSASKTMLAKRRSQRSARSVQPRTRGWIACKAHTQGG
jgi:hypothetical protein